MRMWKKTSIVTCSLVGLAHFLFVAQLFNVNLRLEVNLIMPNVYKMVTRQKSYCIYSKILNVCLIILWTLGVKGCHYT